MSPWTLVRILAGLFSLLFACAFFVYLVRALCELTFQWADASRDEVDPPTQQPNKPQHARLPGRRKDNTDDSKTLPA